MASSGASGGAGSGGSSALTSGPPYPPPTAQLGGTPTIIPDIPISAVFLALYIGCAIGHMTIFKLNMKRGHKFIMSAMIFGYCMCRIVSMILRIAWANYPRNVRLGIAASVFIAAGVLILYFVNVLFAQRIIRATHPNLGWNKFFSATFIVLYVLIPLVLAMIITATIQSYYTLDTSIRRIDTYLRLAAISYLLFFSFLPIPLLALNFLIPKPKGRHIDQFGKGRYGLKVGILFISTLLLLSGTTFRAATEYVGVAGQPRQVDNPAWYQSKACFWVFNIGVEIIVAYLYILLRVDLRFYVADGADGPGSYSVESIHYLSADPDAAKEKEREADEGETSVDDSSSVYSVRPQPPRGSRSSSRRSSGFFASLWRPPQMFTMDALVVLPEEQVFDDMSVHDPEEAARRRRSDELWSGMVSEPDLWRDDAASQTGRREFSY